MKAAIVLVRKQLSTLLEYIYKNFCKSKVNILYNKLLACDIYEASISIFLFSTRVTAAT